MKNKIKLALLLLLSLSFLGACNNQNTSSNPDIKNESTVSEAENEVTDKREKLLKIKNPIKFPKIKKKKKLIIKT